MKPIDIRYISNPFQKIFTVITPDNERLYNILFTDIQQWIKGSQLPTLTAIASDPSRSQVDIGGYNGVGGYAYTLIRIGRFVGKMMGNKEKSIQTIIQRSRYSEDLLVNKLLNSEYYLGLANQQYNLISQYCIKYPSTRKTLSFYMSQTCTWLCGMQLAYESRNQVMFRDNEKKLLNCFQMYKKQKGELMWELLYGVPGLLYTYLELQRQFDNHTDEHYRTNFSTITKILTVDIIKSGISVFENQNNIKINAEDLKSELPEHFRLCYYFHKKQYLGGAHGLGGNINILLLSFQINKFTISELTIYCRLISKSIKYLLRHFINGNFASSAGGQNIKLVHFCHGAPGILGGLVRFMNMFPEEGIRLGLTEIVQKGLKYVWEYGILKKGFGLCHGISGNAYLFIAPSIQIAFPQLQNQLLKKARLFLLLKQQKQVMKEIKSYDFEDRMMVGVGDQPYSLMIGLAGDICFEMDVIEGVGRFPGFDF